MGAYRNKGVFNTPSEIHTQQVEISLEILVDCMNTATQTTIELEALNTILTSRVQFQRLCGTIISLENVCITFNLWSPAFESKLRAHM